MCVCVCLYVCVFTGFCVFVCVCMHLCLYVYLCVSEFKEFNHISTTMIVCYFLYKCVCVCVYVVIFVFVCVYLHVCVFVCVCVCMHLCMLICLTVYLCVSVFKEFNHISTTMIVCYFLCLLCLCLCFNFSPMNFPEACWVCHVYHGFQHFVSVKQNVYSGNHSTHDKLTLPDKLFYYEKWGNTC